MLAALGLLWSPIAGITCARVARSRGLDTRRYAITGTVYSILLLLPWIYLWSQLRNKPLRESNISRGYALVYGLWLLGPIAMTGIFVALSFEPRRDPAEPIVLAVMLVLAVISSLHQIVANANMRSTRVHNSLGRSTDLLITFRQHNAICLHIHNDCAIFVILHGGQPFNPGGYWEP